MRLPRGSRDLEEAKATLASAYQAMEMRLEYECAELAKSGFADKRLAAMAHSKFEEAFLLLGKALRRGAPNDYAKAPYHEAPPDSFTPEPDAMPERNVGDRERHLGPPPGAIEWHDYKF